VDRNTRTKKAIRHSADRAKPVGQQVLQPDLAESFRMAKAALEIATRDIAELRRRATRLGRGSG
jgi:hypothetical protein